MLPAATPIAEKEQSSASASPLDFLSVIDLVTESKPAAKVWIEYRRPV
jgi:hypothetical protein